MRRSRIVALTGAVALATTALGGTTATAALHTTPTASASSTASAGSGTYVVLADRGADVRAIADALRKSGATVTSVNTDIGLISVRSGSAGFLKTARGLSGVKAAANDGVVGRSPDAGRVQDRVLKEHQASPNRSSGPGKTAKKGANGRPARRVAVGHDHDRRPAGAPGRAREQEGQGRRHGHRARRHPPRHRAELRRQGVAQLRHRHARHRRRLCEHPSCIDPVNEDDNGHGTHIAGTMAAALNGIGIVRRRAQRQAWSTSAPARTAATSSSAPRSTRSPTPATPASTS